MTIEFNTCGCGVSLPLVPGNALATIGVLDCVVLQVLSNEYVFAAHLSTDDIGYPLKLYMLKDFCNHLNARFLEHNSRITRCTVCYNNNYQESLIFARGIIGQIRGFLGVPTRGRGFNNIGAGFNNDHCKIEVNANRGLDVGPLPITERIISLGNGTVDNRTRRDIREARLDSYLRGARNGMFFNGTVPGFAVGIYEYDDKEDDGYYADDEFA